MSIYHTDAAEVVKGRKYVIGYVSKDGDKSGSTIMHCKDNNVAEYEAILFCMREREDVTVVRTDSTAAIRMFDENHVNPPIDVQYVPRGSNTAANMFVKSRKELLPKKRKR